MASFMDYYADELRKRGGASPKRSTLPTSIPTAKTTEKPDAYFGESAVNWVMDMISRPTYGMVNANTENVNRQAQGAKRIAQGDTAGGIAEYISGLPQMPSFLSPFTSPALDLFKKAAGNDTDQKFLQGLVNPSNDPALKKSNADLIEHTRDAFGRNLQPQTYRDVEDNVDPLVKGIGGFALDVAGDPLTYLSGTGILAGAKGIAKGVDRGLTSLSEGLAGSAAVKGASTAASRAAAAEKQAAQAAARDAKTAKAAEDELGNPLPEDGMMDPGSFRPTPRDSGKVEQLETYGSDLALIDDVLRGSTYTPPRPAGVAPKLALEGAPAAARASSPVDDLLGDATRLGGTSPTSKPQAPTVGPALADDVTNASGDIPMGGQTIADLILNSPNRQGLEQILTRVADDVDASAQARPFDPRKWAETSTQKFAVQLPGDGQLRSYDAATLARIATGNPNTARGKAAREAVSIALRDAKLRHGEATVTPIDAMTAFSRLLEVEETHIKAALGDDLTDYLRRVNNPGKFHRLLDSIKGVIEPDASVTDVLRNMDQNLARLLESRLGLPRAARMRSEEEAAEVIDRILRSDEPYTAALADGLADALTKELKGQYPVRFTKDGLRVGKTKKGRGQGLGRYVDQLNGFSQYTMLRSQGAAIDLAAQEIMRVRGIKGLGYQDLKSAQRTAVYKEAVLKVLADQAQILDDLGVHMSVGLGTDTVQLSMYEVYRGILAAADDLGTPKTIDQGLFNYGTQAAPTALTDAAAAAVAGKGYDEVLAILLDPKKYGSKGLLKGRDGKRPNNLIDSGHGWGFTSRKAAYRVAEELTGNARDARKLVRTKEKGRTSKATGEVRRGDHFWLQYRQGDRNYMAEALADAIMKASGDLKLRAASNEASYVARTRAEVHKLATDELSKIDAFLSAPLGVIAKIRASKAQEARIAADAEKINASADSVAAADEVVDASLGEELATTMRAAEKAQAKAEPATTAVALREATDSFTDDVWEAVADEFDARPAGGAAEDPVTGLRPNEEWAEPVDESTPLYGDWRDMLYDEAADFIGKGPKRGKKGGRKGPYVNLSEDAPRMVDAFGQRIIDPYGKMKHNIRGWFDQNYKAPEAMRIAHAWQNSMSMRTAYVAHQLNAINRIARRVSPDRDILPSIFSAIQRGETYGGADDAVREIDTMVRRVLDDFFDLDDNGSMGNVFLRTTSKPELINNMLKQKGIDEVFDLDAAQKLASTGVPLDEALAGQWRSWKVKDPLDFMHRMSMVRQELAFNKGVAMSFIDLAKSRGAFSTKRGKGLVRIQASGESRFMAHLPEDAYVSKELAEELRRVEQVFRTSREFQGQLGEFVRNTYAPLLNAWKFAITLPRPGHHIRNLIGDTSVTWMRRGNQHFAQSWKDAVKVLGTRARYTDVDMLEAATRYGIKDLPKRGESVFKSGRYEFTADELYAALAEGGALPTYHIGEDFLDAAGGLNSFLGKLTLRDTRVGEGLGKLSEGRDHLARFQHFIQALRQDGKNWKGSREALIEKAVREVTKYHPDASLLTTVESKLRLAIPFYSWFGKIIPALVESMVMHPGRLSTFNKASYNSAVAMGVDPESLSDPFPNDQLFPNFITEQALGPQFQMPGGEYIRTNPGLAHLDVMNTLGADPLRGIAGMTSPLVRVPAELLSGGSWGTGAPIRDWSDYLDQSLPGVNYIANISGVSPTGSVESLLQGRGLDEQAQVARGNKGDFDKMLSIANWITGLGFQNLSRPNYINYAEIEKRNEAGRE